MKVNCIPNLIIHYSYIYNLFLMNHIYDLQYVICTEILFQNWFPMYTCIVWESDLLKMYAIKLFLCAISATVS